MIILRKLFCYLTLCLALTFPATAQEKNQKSPCADDAHFSDFDFWLGEWEVIAQIQKQVAGTNLIKKVERGCLIVEKWTGAKGSSGTSMNYYNPNNEKWRQVWVAPGYIIDIEGGLNEDGAMVLKGYISNFGQGERPFRGTWTPNEDGTVRQFFEQMNTQAGRWDPWFDGLYRRKD